jgi:PAS domain S-box-containing protein
MMPSDQTTILVIDDDDAVRLSIADYLEDLDYRIVTAENGRIGIERFQTEAIDFVLVDLRMPEMGGLEVLEKIAEMAPDTPRIVVSGTGVITDAVEALHRGAWDYILKPIEDFSVLRHAIETNLEKARLKKENLQYQQHLEQMVSDRTKELEQANRHLSDINQRLRRIVDTTRSLSFCSEVKRFGSRLLDEFGQHMAATGGSLYLKEEKGFRLLHALDPDHAPEFIPFPLAETSVFKRAFDDKLPILIRDMEKEKNLSTSGWGNYSSGSAMIFPLPDESGEIAAILALHSKRPSPFMEQDKEIGSILASYSCEALRAVRTTEKLLDKERQFRSILDNIRAGIVIVDIDTRKIAYVNPIAAEMMESAPEKLLGTSCFDAMCPDKRGKCPVLDLGVQIDSTERTLETRSGHKIPVLKTVTHILFQGKECLLESFIDLTVQKNAAAEKEKLETQLRQAQKMEALGTLAGGIAHDFNNILSAVIGYSELGLIDIGDESVPIYQNLQSIFHAGNRAKELVGQILTFSRMQEHILTPVSVEPIVKETLKLLKASLPANIELESHIATKKRIMADATQIHQVIMNLCTNAYHAMEEKGGRLSVRLSDISFDLQTVADFEDLVPGPYLQLEVEDTGEGISPLVMESIFDPYFTTKKKDKGTGLGLSVVHGIIKSHAGAISVNSRVGEGTTFKVLFPICEDIRDPQHQKNTILPCGSEKILLVDDEKDIVAIGSKMLDKLGYEVTSVVGSVPALETFRKTPQQFDLVISDFNMPGISGDRLAMELLTIRPDLPIILCTGFSERFDQGRATMLGIRKVIMKPMSMNELANAIRDVLDAPE